jgi:hypothetical protein
MNMKKKIVSGLMAMAMATMSMGLTAFAADDVQMSIGNTEVEKDAAFTVDVNLDAVPSAGLSSIDFAINYDSSLLTITDVKLKDAGNTGAASKEGELGETVFNWYKTDKQIIIIWATGLTDSQYWVKSTGKFLEISGTAKGAEGSKADLKIQAVDRAAYPGSSAKANYVFSGVGTDKTVDYTASFTDGYVKIKENAPVITTTPKPKDADWGNANEDDAIDVSDAVLMAKFAASDSSAKITDQGKINADVTHDGNVDDQDVTKVLKYIARLIAKDALATK